MSSLRVRTTNKVMLALGVVKPSTNVAFDLAYSDFESTLQKLATLDSVLKFYMYSIKKFHGAASSVMVAIDDLSSGDNRSPNYQQTSTGSLTMKQFAGEARVACADVDRIVLQETCDRFEHEVLIPVNKWLQHARNLQSKAVAFQTHKTLYDHYSRKVVALREAHEKRVSSGRSESTRSTERMFRNKQKLVATTQKYTHLSETIVRELRAFVVAREATLAPLLYRVLQGRMMHVVRMNEATNRIRVLLKDNLDFSKHCLEVGAVSTTDARGGEYPDSQVDTMSPVPAKFMVLEASFDTFVGEASHEAATHQTRLKSACNDGGTAFASPSALLSKRKIQIPFQTRQDADLSKPGYTPPHGIPHFMKSIVSMDAAGRRSCDSGSSVAAVDNKVPTETSLLVNSCLSVKAKKFWDIFSVASAPSVDL